VASKALAPRAAAASDPTVYMLQILGNLTLDVVTDTMVQLIAASGTNCADARWQSEYLSAVPDATDQAQFPPR